MSLLDPATDSLTVKLPRLPIRGADSGGLVPEGISAPLEATGEPITGAAYPIKSAYGRLFQEKTVREGFTGPGELDDMRILRVEFEEREHRD